MADEDTSMQSLAERMIKEGCATAYITRGDTLCGIVTSNDILKYYQYKNSSGGQAFHGLTALEVVNHGSGLMSSTYTAKIPETECGACESLFSVLISAVHQHCREKFKSKCSLTSGTFYSLEDCNSCNLIVSSEILKSEQHGCMIAVEIYDDAAIYARSIFMVSLSDDTETEK
jgi:predicted transcriptional regulator